MGVNMEKRHFYFVKDEFYNALPDCYLMTNKGLEGKGGRPCHYCFESRDFFWMIPISSKVEKYRQIYESKIKKYGYCDTIRFGYVNGEKRAFLIQNCFPITSEYIDCEYLVDKGKTPVTISSKMSEELDKLMNKVLKLYSKGITLPLTKIDKIIRFLTSK